MEKLENILRKAGTMVDFTDKVCATVIKDMVHAGDIDAQKDEDLIIYSSHESGVVEVEVRSKNSRW